MVCDAFRLKLSEHARSSGMGYLEAIIMSAYISFGARVCVCVRACVRACVRVYACVCVGKVSM